MSTGSLGTDSASDGEEDASPSSTKNDILLAGLFVNLDLILILLAKKKHIKNLLKMI